MYKQKKIKMETFKMTITTSSETVHIFKNMSMHAIAETLEIFHANYAEMGNIKKIIISFEI